MTDQTAPGGDTVAAVEDEGTDGMFDPAVIGPTVDFPRVWPATDVPWSST
jgi:hypothetical protein